VAISEDGKHVLTGDKDGQALIWSFKDGNTIISQLIFFFLFIKNM
jgi:hypothetical protein